MMKETVLDCDFVILNRIPSLYSAQRFQSEIKRFNHKAQLVTPEWLIENASHFETRGQSLGVLYRQGDFNFWTTQAGLAKLPFKIINTPQAFLNARDKWRTAQVWQKQNIPTPKTGVLTDYISVGPSLNMGELFHSLQEKFGLPFIVKKRFSSQGQGVFLIKDNLSLATLIDQDSILFTGTSDLELNYFRSEFGSDKIPLSNWIQLRRWIVQECILESLGTDTRVFTIQNEQYSITRHNTDSFKSNLHQGGKAQVTQLTPIEAELSQRIHRLSELSYSGIDFLRTQDGPKFLEINPSPGFEGIETNYRQNMALKLLNQFSD